MNRGYCSALTKEALIYNIQYHLMNNFDTKEECVEKIKVLLENLEAKDNDRENE